MQRSDAQPLQRDAKLPVVLLDRDIYEAPQRSKFDLVSLDNSRAGFELGCHLLERERSKMIFVGDPHQYSSTAARLSGLRKALSLQDLTLFDDRVVEAEDAGFGSILKWIHSGEVDAVVCNSDHDAALLMRECLSAGIDIPGQMALAGFDDQPIAQLLTVPLTTVAQPMQGLAIRAISALRDRMSFPDIPPTTVRIQGPLIVREST